MGLLYCELTIAIAVKFVIDTLRGTVELWTYCVRACHCQLENSAVPERRCSCLKQCCTQMTVWALATSLQLFSKSLVDEVNAFSRVYTHLCLSTRQLSPEKGSMRARESHLKSSCTQQTSGVEYDSSNTCITSMAAREQSQSAYWAASNITALSSGACPLGHLSTHVMHELKIPIFKTRLTYIPFARNIVTK